MAKKPPAKQSTTSRIFRVVSLASTTGQVIRDTHEIDETTAVAIRQAEGDVVVCGDDISNNRQIAEAIERMAHSHCKAEKPHVNRGSNALPHYQPLTRPPWGHTFFETGKRKAKKIRRS